MAAFGESGGTEAMRRLDGTNIGQPPLLDQAILQRLVRAFDPALRLRRVRVDQFDAQSLHNPPELGLAVAALGILRFDPENAVPIRVERQRAAVFQNAAAQRRYIGSRGP